MAENPLLAFAEEAEDLAKMCRRVRRVDLAEQYEDQADSMRRLIQDEPGTAAALARLLEGIDSVLDGAMGEP